MPESTQHRLDRVRPPRVHITYDLETRGAIEMRELPFVVGIMADLAGMPETPPAPLKERSFVNIDRDNFNEVMEKIAPRLTIQVDNTLTDEDSKLNVELNFTNIESFDPVNLIDQVEPLKKLFDARTRLNDLVAKLAGNDDLDQLLQEVATNTDGLKEIQQETQKSQDDEG